MSSPNDIPPLDKFEQLFVNNADLDRIGRWLGRFNPIQVMGMAHMEIRHSAILGWLLDPAETHGFGDRFLKAFLSEALREGSGGSGISALVVSQADLSDAEIRREWKNIDLFVLSRKNDWAFIIENKFSSRQYRGQLETYMKRIRKAFRRDEPDLKIAGIFLTLREEEPEDKRYAPIDYEEIDNLLTSLMNVAQPAISPEVEMFLGHYIDVIREAGGSEVSEERKQMESLARELYRKHRRVLDFIMASGVQSGFMEAAQTLVKGDFKPGSIVEIGPENFMASGLDQRIFSFLPGKWHDALGRGEMAWEGCQNWWAGFPLICWLQLWGGEMGGEGRLALYAEVGPLANHDARVRLIRAIEANATERNLNNVGFQRTAADEGRRYSKFFKRNFEDIPDVEDAERLSEAMKQLLERFQPVFDAVAEVLPDFHKQYTLMR